MNLIVHRALAPLLQGLLAAAAAGAQDCPTAVGPDIIAGDMPGIANYASLDGLEAFALGSTACNVGAQIVDVIHDTPDHYILIQNLYRLKDRGGWFAMEQVGMSWLRHGFCSLAQNLCCSNCQPTACSSLGIGCSDPLTANGNGQQTYLRPRWQIDAHGATFPFPQVDPAFTGSTARRIEVAIADLEPTASTSTRYFGEVHYLTPDDAAAANGNNNASHRGLSVFGADDAWTFAMLAGAATQREKPAILAWQDADPSVVVAPVQLPGEGYLILAARATDLGGTWHYEYALYNMNSHDSVRALAIPVPEGSTLSAVGFHDVTYRNGDGEGGVDFDGGDWPGVLQDGALTWQTPAFADDPNANALRWGTTYNFRFDTDAPPVDGDVSLITYRTDATIVVSGVPVPQGGGFGNQFCNDSDGAHAFCPCGNVGDPDAGCDNPQGTGGAFMEATAFAPDGLGGGTAEFTTTGLNPAGSPSYVLLRSTALGAPAAAFDGVLCLGGSVTRVGSGIAAGGTAVEPYVHGAMGAPGLNYYQLWYRSQPVMFCDPTEASNLSNGYDLTW